MKFLDKPKLRKLLEKHSDERVHKAVENGLAGYNAVGKLERENALDVYSIKSETSGGKFDGFPDLLRRLESLEGDYVKVHMVPFQKQQIIVFTDVAIKEVVGCLFPK